MFKKSSLNSLKVIALMVITLMFGLVLAACEDSDTKKFSITVTSNNTSYGTVTGGGSYKEGTKVTLKATPKKDHFFSGWYVDENIVESDVTYTFTVSEDLTIVGHFGANAEGITDFNVFYNMISHSFIGAVGTELNFKISYDDIEQELIVKTNRENGKLKAGIFDDESEYKVWVKDGMQYNYLSYEGIEPKTTKHTYLEDKDNDINMYLNGYMILMLNEASKMDKEDFTFDFSYDPNLKVYYVSITEDVASPAIEIKLNVENNKLIESSFSVDYGVGERMSLIEKIYYKESEKPVIPAVGDYDFIELFWLTYQAPTGDKTEHHSPTDKIPTYFSSDDYFNSSNIEGYYYDQAFSQKANNDDVLTKDTIIYYKLKNSNKIDFTINFTNPELQTIKLKEVYIGQILLVDFTIPEDEISMEYIYFVTKQLRDLGIIARLNKESPNNKFTLEIVMPDETKVVTIE